MGWILPLARHMECGAGVGAEQGQRPSLALALRPEDLGRVLDEPPVVLHHVGGQVLHRVPRAVGGPVALELRGEVHQGNQVDEGAATIARIVVAHELPGRGLLARVEAGADPLLDHHEVLAGEHGVARRAELPGVGLVGAAQAQPDAEDALDLPEPDQLPGDRERDLGDRFEGAGAERLARIELGEDLGEDLTLLGGQLLVGNVAHGDLSIFFTSPYGGPKEVNYDSKK